MQNSIRPLIHEFRSTLRDILQENLVGIYLFGSAAFAGFSPHLADIDFHVVVRKSLRAQERSALDGLHRRFVWKFRYGDRLDGLYIPINKARSSRRPTRLVYAAWGRLHKGGQDTAWALHREHLRRRGRVVLFGPDPKKIYRPTSGSEIAKDLEYELRSLKHHRRRHAPYAILNLCRLIYTWRTGQVVISKRAAGRWAAQRLPDKWSECINAAQRYYDGVLRPNDRTLLAKHVDGFLHFALDEIDRAKRKRLKTRQAFALGAANFTSFPTQHQYGGSSC